jgi:hypothetical protein
MIFNVNENKWLGTSPGQSAIENEKMNMNNDSHLSIKASTQLPQYAQ